MSLLGCSTIVFSTAAATLGKALIQIGAVLIDYGPANPRHRIWIDFGVSELPQSAVIEVELPSELSI
jgi:hypothetical protein